MVIAAANSGIKPSILRTDGTTWGDAKALYQACVDNNVVITFCHQRRFGAQFIKAKQLANEGAIGDFAALKVRVQICLIGGHTGLICSFFIIMTNLLIG